MKLLNTKSSFFQESDLRLDASFHLSDGPITKMKLKKCPFKTTTLRLEASGIFSGNIFKRAFVSGSEFGYSYLTGSDMMKSDIESGKFISKKYTLKANKLMIKKGWILLSCSGTLGNVVLTNDDFDGKVATHDLIRIIPNENETKKGYLYAYLASKYGYGLLTQSSYGGVVKHIEPHHIEELPIPVLPQKLQHEIHKLIEEASSLRVEANKILREAVEYFELKIGQSKVRLGFQYGRINVSSIAGFYRRLDSQYHLLWNNLKQEQHVGSKIDYEKIATFASSIFVGNRGKRIYVEKGISFFSSSDMMLYNSKRFCKKISKNTSGLSTMMVSKNDILISRSGTVGNTVLVGEELENTAISEHALRLVINAEKISPNYVFCYLKTKQGMKSMEASSFGSVIITLNEELIGNINLPILSIESQQIIRDKVDDYLIKINSSSIKENQAISLVEKEIESW